MSPAKVLLNGLGADELLGGYSRHRSAFKFGGWPEVVKQVGKPRFCALVLFYLLLLYSASIRTGANTESESWP